MVGPFIEVAKAGEGGGGGGADVAYGPTPPSSPSAGDIWLDTNASGVGQAGSGRVNSVYATDYGGSWNGIGNDATALQAAIDDVYTNYIFGEVYLPFTVKINSPITTHQTVRLVGPSVIDCNGITTPNSALIIESTPGVPGHYEVAYGLWLKGHPDLIDNPVSYKAGLYGVRHKTFDVSMRACTFTGFERGETFTDSAYITTMYGCNFRYNNYGIYFDAAEAAIAGERLAHISCSTGNNNYGAYNLGAYMWFNNCSFDYNRQQHIYNNNLLDGIPGSGWVGSNMDVDQCHLESTNAYSAGATIRRIINHGNLAIRGGAVREDVEAQPYINNTGQLFIGGGITFLQLEGKYILEGAGSVRLGEIETTHPGQVVRINRQYSGVRNNGFESTLLTDGWTILTGTNATASTTQAKEGTKSLRIGSTGAGTATEIRSDKSFIPPGTQQVFMSFYIITAGLTVQPRINFRVYAMDATTILTDNFVDFPTGQATWYPWALSITPPAGGGYYDIRVNVPASATTTQYAYLDEFYVRVI